MFYPLATVTGAPCVGEAMSSAGSGSDTDGRDSVDDSVKVTHRLHATRTPFITSCCVELAFCALMSDWMSDNEHYTVFFRLHQAKIGGVGGV